LDRTWILQVVRREKFPACSLWSFWYDWTLLFGWQTGLSQKSTSSRAASVSGTCATPWPRVNSSLRVLCHVCRGIFYGVFLLFFGERSFQLIILCNFLESDVVASANANERATVAATVGRRDMTATATGSFVFCVYNPVCFLWQQHYFYLFDDGVFIISVWAKRERGQVRKGDTRAEKDYFRTQGWSVLRGALCEVVCEGVWGEGGGGWVRRFLVFFVAVTVTTDFRDVTAHGDRDMSALCVVRTLLFRRRIFILFSSISNRWTEPIFACADFCYDHVCTHVCYILLVLHGGRVSNALLVFNVSIVHVSLHFNWV